MRRNKRWRDLSERRRPQGGIMVDYDALRERALRGNVADDIEAADVARILEQANDGSTEDQSRLAMEIEERSWDVGFVLSVRRSAVMATDWSIEPPDGDTSARARQIADACAEWLAAAGDSRQGLAGVDGLIEDMLTALLPGFSVVATDWAPGGEGVRGWRLIEPWHVHFRGSYQPLLITEDDPAGVPLPDWGAIVHRHQVRRGDLARGGLIRPCAWLYVLQRGALVDWMQFMERFGMPFLVAKLGQEAWERDRGRVKAMIQGFAAAGGGVFSDAVDVQLLNNAFTATSNNVYQGFADEYVSRKAAQVVLGQTSTTDSANSNRSTAAVHNLVRMDIRDADCKRIAATVREQILVPLVRWNFGAEAPVPRMVWDLAEPLDRRFEAEIVQLLTQAGYDVPDDEVSDRVGYRVTRRAGSAVALSGEGDSPMDAAQTVLQSALADVGETDAWQAALGDVPGRIEALAQLSDEEFDAGVAALRADLDGMLTGMDAGPLADVLGNLIYDARARGAAARAADLARREREATR